MPSACNAGRAREVHGERASPFRNAGLKHGGGLSGSGEIDLVAGDLTLNTTGFPASRQDRRRRRPGENGRRDTEPVRRSHRRRRQHQHEKGAGAPNLKVDAERATSIRTLIGAKTVYDFGNLRIEPRLVWSHDFGDINAPVRAHLAAAPTAGSFQTYGAELKRDSLLLGLSVSGEVRKGTSMLGDVQLNYNSRQQGVAALMGVRSSW